ncbi:hypothetical protein WN55_10036 [Dufourea novaeangliae]|uniref:Uncharacterized protein n=1 Tax=Dufourea novaeangliae TaxID=178035 RepID=A0A154P8B6_DUFNO|nr:hypothetical protein WN55_10036 [Dufourea novaeangliae]
MSEGKEINAYVGIHIQLLTKVFERTNAVFNSSCNSLSRVILVQSVKLSNCLFRVRLGVLKNELCRRVSPCAIALQPACVLTESSLVVEPEYEIRRTANGKEREVCVSTRPILGQLDSDLSFFCIRWPSYSVFWFTAIDRCKSIRHGGCE